MLTLEEKKKINKEDRIEFVKFWANYIKNNPNKVWSKQQKELIDSFLKK